MIRKKSEHNELIIGTLEELSLHQENIEKIDQIQNYCRELKILYLQGNLIARIENLWKLKRLVYLNLAINNIETIENLDKLESLEKLDLTVNFIGDLESVSALRNNYSLRELILTGNPCADYVGYRDYVIHVLPQLDSLDLVRISKFDQLQAQKKFPHVEEAVKRQQTDYFKFRVMQKIRVGREIEQNNREMSLLRDEESRNKFFWDTKCEHSPETRVEIANQFTKLENAKLICKDAGENTANPKPLFKSNGHPLNLNEGKFDFKFSDNLTSYELELFIPRFMDIDHVKVDVETNYVRVTIKNKTFQLVLDEDVKINDSKSLHNQITGHLLVEMPKLTVDSELMNIHKKQQHNPTAKRTP